MATEQHSTEPATTKRVGPEPKKAKKGGWGWLAALGIVAAAAGGGFFFMGAKNESHQEGGKEHAKAEGEHHRSESGEGNTILVVRPTLGGMERTTNQPGTIRAFEFADLFAKLSGYVRNLTVDRGSRVKKGQTLLEVYDPERKVAVDQAQAELRYAKAAEVQAEARVKVAIAAVQAAEANKEQAKAILEEMNAKWEYRKKQYARIYDLWTRNGIEERLVDEQRDDMHAAEASVHSAKAGIMTAEAQLIEAQSNVDKAKADLDAAHAQVGVNQAHLDMANVMLEYTQIKSPYDGVVTFRGEAVHDGAFIRSAAEGGDNALLTVARSDKFRTIVLVPDTDSPYCKVGNDTEILFDALPGRIFHGTVSRISEAEDLNDRNMRVEVDLENQDGSLRDGMWGRANILLEKIVKNLTIPSQCMISKNGKGESAVMVIKDGEIHRTNVLVGVDNGLRVEVISGLTDKDQVILRPDPSVLDGTKAVAREAAAEDLKKHS